LGLEELGRGRLDGGDGTQECRMCWKQNQVNHSRKQVAPLLRQAMKEWSKL
jgi:exopolyphosphatase